MNKPAELEIPPCTEIKQQCGAHYQCTCPVTGQAQLTNKDFAIARFLFFSPNVPYAQAGLGGAFLLSFIITVLFRQQRSANDAKYVLKTYCHFSRAV
jgi:hypothetical protein